MVGRRLKYSLLFAAIMLAMSQAGAQTRERVLDSLSAEGYVSLAEFEVIFPTGSDMPEPVSQRGFLIDIRQQSKKGLNYIYILGHTDDRGDVAYNQDLSERRVAAAQRMLLQAGYADTMLLTKALGELEPREKNLDDATRRANRRVEVMFMKKIPKAMVRKSAASGKTLRGLVVDQASGTPLSARVTIRRADNGEVLAHLGARDNGDRWSQPIAKSFPLEITASSAGYAPKTIAIAPDAWIGLTELTADIELEKFQVGQKIVLRWIYFFPNRDVIRPSSDAQLRELLFLMKSNPSLHIRLLGHVNHPLYLTQPPPPDTRELSWNRARAVRDYLIRNGIAANRMTFEGRSNTEMKYPHAATNEEMYANMRTEIEVTQIK